MLSMNLLPWLNCKRIMKLSPESIVARFKKEIKRKLLMDLFSHQVTCTERHTAPTSLHRTTLQNNSHTTVIGLIIEAICIHGIT